MVNPVVRVVIRGEDLDALRRFYHEALGWESFVITDDFAVIEMYPHEHDPETSAEIARPVVIDTRGGAIVWRYEGEVHPSRSFAPGAPEGGIGRGPAAVVAFVEVGDLEATLARVKAAGGTVVQRPFAIPGYTTIARFRDVAGNEIGLQIPLP